jgi:serine/threonine-protein kinase HipA
LKTIEDFRLASKNRLDVYVNGLMVAILARESNNYILTYLPDTKPENFVSLTMPVRVESWVSEGRLHPFFETNLPEGARRTEISEAFGKAMMSEDIALLALIGSDMVGRVNIVPKGFTPDWKNTMSLDIDTAVHTDTDQFFAETARQYAESGVSGVQPKLLSSDTRMTAKIGGWIIKRDGTGMPGLSINEYLSMKAAKNCGMDVAESRLSDDGKALYVKRFDLAARGFEDFCGLLGMASTEKYSGSIERLVKVAGRIITNRQGMVQDILRSVAFNACIGNSDAHLKNFGVVYDDTNNVSLSPFYDLVSVRAFDEFKNDIPSLSLGGKKEWAIGKAFHAFAASLGVSKKETESILFAVSAGVSATIPSIIEMANTRPAFREHAKRMVASWSAGLRRLNGEKILTDDYSVLSGFKLSAPHFSAKKSVTTKPRLY